MLFFLFIVSLSEELHFCLVCESFQVLFRLVCVVVSFLLSDYIISPDPPFRKSEIYTNFINPFYAKQRTCRISIDRPKKLCYTISVGLPVGGSFFVAYLCECRQGSVRSLLWPNPEGGFLSSVFPQTASTQCPCHDVSCSHTHLSLSRSRIVKSFSVRRLLRILLYWIQQAFQTFQNHP